VVVSAKSRLDVSLRVFPRAYWKYLLVIALFGIGNSSTAFLILQTQDIGASLEVTILIYAAFNLVAALISYPAGYLSDRWGRKNILLSSFFAWSHDFAWSHASSWSAQLESTSRHELVVRRHPQQKGTAWPTRKGTRRPQKAPRLQVARAPLSLAACKGLPSM
jgi:MFS family permease